VTLTDKRSFRSPSGSVETLQASSRPVTVRSDRRSIGQEGIAIPGTWSHVFRFFFAIPQLSGRSTVAIDGQ